MNKFFKGRFVCGLVAILLVMTPTACSGKDNGGSASAGSDFEAEPIDGGKGVRITKYVGDKWEVNIPSKIQGLPVTHIGEIQSGHRSDYHGAFARKKLIRVTIPNSVTTIEPYAFSYNQLTSITIPNNVTTIGGGAFGHNQLTSITIPNSVTIIEYSAFDNNQLTSITIPNNVTTIGFGAFGHNQLTSITIPNSVTKIGEFAFADNQLTSITIPNSVTTIEMGAFNNNQLTSITIGAGVTLNGRDITVYHDESNNKFIISGFTEFYNNNGKAAGTYTRPDANSTNWTKK